MRGNTASKVKHVRRSVFAPLLALQRCVPPRQKGVGESMQQKRDALQRFSPERARPAGVAQPSRVLRSGHVLAGHVWEARTGLQEARRDAVGAWLLLVGRRGAAVCVNAARVAAAGVARWTRPVVADTGEWRARKSRETGAGGCLPEVAEGGPAPRRSRLMDCIENARRQRTRRQCRRASVRNRSSSDRNHR